MLHLPQFINNIKAIHIYLFQKSLCSPCGTILLRTKPIFSKRMRTLVNFRVRGGWPRAELHYTSVYIISHAVRISGKATEDPLKAEFLSSFWCEC